MTTWEERMAAKAAARRFEANFQPERWPVAPAADPWVEREEMTLRVGDSLLVYIEGDDHPLHINLTGLRTKEGWVPCVYARPGIAMAGERDHP